MATMTDFEKAVYLRSMLEAVGNVLKGVQEGNGQTLQDAQDAIAIALNESREYTEAAFRAAQTQELAVPPGHDPDEGPFQGGL